MLKYHVAVCDDEKSDLDGIVQSVQQYDVQGCFDIETYMDGNELLSELQMQKKSFDLLLLDIEMPSNGFQLAQSLIQMEKHPLVVFVTKRHEYAVQGYGIAFRYLVKPLDQTLFAAAMDAVLQELNSKHFTIEYDGVTMSLETSDIYFLESHGHKVLIHCKEQDLTLRMSINLILINYALSNMMAFFRSSLLYILFFTSEMWVFVQYRKNIEELSDSKALANLLLIICVAIEIGLLYFFGIVSGELIPFKIKW